MRKPSVVLSCGAALLAIATFDVSSAAAQTAQRLDDTAQQTTTSSGDTAEPTSAESSTKDIVVTGTLVRGVAPVGTNVLTLSAQDIRESGANSANEVLARVPQVTNFFNTTPVVGTGNSTTVNVPQIRNLPTLVLIDGHRIASAGTVVTGVDPAIIPPGVLERVEVVPDGGSSIYGSDAVGGVINFTTRRRVNGIAANARYGTGDNFHSVDADVTVGKDWGTGSVYAAYAYSKRDAIFGRDRAYVRQIAPSASCVPGTVTISNAGVNTTYRLPDRTPNTLAQCDASDNLALIPEELRHSVFAGLSQDLSDGVHFDMRGFYTHRLTTNYLDQLTSSGTITSANPFFVPIGTETSQTVAYSYAGVIGPSSRQETQLDEWGISPSMSFDLGRSFQLRVLGNYSRSYNRGDVPEVDTTLEAAALAGTTTATALNPYNLTQTSPALIQAITGRNNRASAKTDLYNARAVIDGGLFTLPGGSVRVAAGGELIHEVYNPTTLITAADGSIVDTATVNASRTVESVFGELVIPLFSAQNAIGGFSSLSLDVSGRYDHYSDFGGTFNPKFGATYRPIDWFTVRGNYGTSFVAPGLADTQAVDTRVSVLPVSPFLRAGDPFFPNFLRPTVLLAGGNPNLKPQKAKTWSAGFDLRPPFIDGLSISGTYYNVRYKDQLGIAPFFNPTLLYTPTYANFVFLSPTLAQVTALTQGLRLQGAPSIASLFSGPFGGPYVLVDARRQNLAIVKTDGVDFDVNYRRETGFGSVNAGVSGTYTLSRKTAAAAGLPFDDNAKYNLSRFSAQATLGAKIGALRASTTFNHSAGYDLTPGSVAGQSHVDAFNTLDAFLSYDLGVGRGVLGGVALTLNVNNLLDEEPPFYNLDNGYIGATVLGRYVQVGISKKF